MYLHGKHFTRVEKLEEQRKTKEARSQLSHQLRSILFHQSTDSLALQRSVGDQALMIVTIAEYPRFANRTVTG